MHGLLSKTLGAAMRARVLASTLLFFLPMANASAQSGDGLATYVSTFSPSNAHALCTVAMTTSLRTWGFSQIKQHDRNLVFGRSVPARVGVGAFHASCYCWSPSGFVIVTVYGPDISASAHFAEYMANEIAGHQ